MFNPETVEWVNWAVAFFILGGISVGFVVWACMTDGAVRVEEPTEHGGRPL